jgi:hypothetical protein
MVSDSGAVASVFNSRAVAAVPSGLLWQANTAVVNWFDNSANWLAGLPANPVGDLLQVGLVMVRRSLFNQAPTTEPMQIKTLVNGQILGTLGAVDPEGDTLSYTLTRIPQEGVISGIYREPAGTVQISPDRLCVSWAADVIHCGVFGKETTTSWVVNNATGTKSQLYYQAKMNVESVELTITRQDVLLLSPSTDEFAHSVVSDFEFSKNTLRLATRLDIRDPAAVIYNCSNWQKKPWWEWS